MVYIYFSNYIWKTLSRRSRAISFSLAFTNCVPYHTLSGEILRFSMVEEYKKVIQHKELKVELLYHRCMGNGCKHIAELNSNKKANFKSNINIEFI